MVGNNPQLGTNLQQFLDEFEWTFNHPLNGADAARRLHSIPQGPRGIPEHTLESHTLFLLRDKGLRERRLERAQHSGNSARTPVTRPVRRAPPPVVRASPPVSQAPLPESRAPPLLSRAPPPGSPATPPVSRASPPVSQAPLPESRAPPPGSPVTPPVSRAPPPVSRVPHQPQHPAPSLSQPPTPLLPQDSSQSGPAPGPSVPRPAMPAPEPHAPWPATSAPEPHALKKRVWENLCGFQSVVILSVTYGCEKPDADQGRIRQDCKCLFN